MGTIVKWGIRLVASFFAGIGAEQVADRVVGDGSPSGAPIRFSFGSTLILFVGLLAALFYILKPKKRRKR